MNEPHNEAEYVQGQLHGLACLIFALADFIDRDEFVARAQWRLENLRTVTLSRTVGESWIVGIDRIKELLERMTR